MTALLWEFCEDCYRRAKAFAKGFCSPEMFGPGHDETCECAKRYTLVGRLNNKCAKKHGLYDIYHPPPRCWQHPEYDGKKRRPTSSCWLCWLVWADQERKK